MSLHLTPLRLTEANKMVASLHRHHKPVLGALFAIGASLDGKLIGAVIVGRPVARMLDDGLTVEVTRLVTDGTKNACSMLYSAAWRAAKAMGYRKMITYILEAEPGTSLKAAGWVCENPRCGGGSWDRTDRPRDDKAPICFKQRWAVIDPV